MVTRAEVLEVFDPDELTVMPAMAIDGLVTDPDARRVLTEVGLPVDLLNVLLTGSFEVSGPPQRLGELYRMDPDGMPPGTAHYLVITHGLGGVACLDGRDGRVYWYKPGDDESYGLVNTSLDRYVELLTKLWRELGSPALTVPDEPDEAEVVAQLRRLVAELRPVDPESFDSPVMFWQRVILNALREIAATE